MSRINMLSQFKSELNNISSFSNEDLLFYYDEFCFLINDESLELLKSSDSLLQNAIEKRAIIQQKLDYINQIDPYKLQQWQSGDSDYYKAGSISEINDTKRDLRKINIRIKNLQMMKFEYDLIGSILTAFELEINKRNLSLENNLSI